MLDEPPCIVRTENGSRLAPTVFAWVIHSPGLAELLNGLLMSMSGFCWAYNVQLLSTAASSLILGLSDGGRG